MGAGQSSSSRRRPGDEEIDRVCFGADQVQNQVIQALTPHVNAQSQPLPPPNTPPPAPIPGAPPSSHDPPGASPMPLPMPPPSSPAPATSPSTSYLRTCTICGKEAYWRNGCCMNPTCTATRLSINCTLMHCNLCFRFLIFTKEVQDLLSQNIYWCWRASRKTQRGWGFKCRLSQLSFPGKMIGDYGRKRLFKEVQDLLDKLNLNVSKTWYLWYEHFCMAEAVKSYWSM